MFKRYLWIVKNGPTIEMAGNFVTEQRWQQFCKKPHPLRNDVTIMEIK